MQLRRGLPVEARDLSRLDAAALEKVRAEVAPSPRGPDELHDLLLVHPGPSRPADWQEWFERARGPRAGHGSARGRRARAREAGRRGRAEPRLWCAPSGGDWAEALFPEASFEPDYRLPRRCATSGPTDRAHEREAPDADVAAALAVRGHLQLTGPVTVERPGLPVLR